MNYIRLKELAEKRQAQQLTWSDWSEWDKLLNHETILHLLSLAFFEDPETGDLVARVGL